jgi:hypothetical protein
LYERNDNVAKKEIPRNIQELSRQRNHVFFPYGDDVKREAREVCAVNVKKEKTENYENEVYQERPHIHGYASAELEHVLKAGA